VKRLLPVLDRVVDGGLIALLVFTPLAFGAVEEWAQAIAQLLAATVFAAWVLKVTWGPAPLLAAEPSDHSWFGGRVVPTGLEVPALLFAGLVLFQILPLPRAAQAALSPAAVRITDGALPRTEGPLHSEAFETWLLSGPDRPSGPSGRLPPGDRIRSSLPDVDLHAGSGSTRTLSLDPAATARRLATFLAYLGVFVVGVHQWRDRRKADRILAVLATLVGALAVFGVVQHLTWNGRIYWLRTPTQGGDPFGPFVNRNNFAGYLEMAVPLALGLAVAVRQGRMNRSDTSEKLLAREERSLPLLLLLGAGAAFGLVALIASRSRGGLLSLLTATALFCVASLRRGRRATWAMGPLLLLGLLIGAVGLRVGGDGIWQRYATLAHPEGEPSLAFRLDMAQRTLSMLSDFPLVGVGLGAFGDLYGLYAPGDRAKRAGAAHNDYAQLAAESGMIGAALAAGALILFMLRYLWPALRRQGSARRHVMHGVAVGFIAMLVHSLFEFNLQIYSNGLLFTVLGALLVADAQSRPQRPLPMRRPSPPDLVAPSGG